MAYPQFMYSLGLEKQAAAEAEIREKMLHREHYRKLYESHTGQILTGRKADGSDVYIVPDKE